MVTASEKVKRERGVLSALVYRLEERAVVQEIEQAIGIDARFPEALSYRLLGCIFDNLEYLEFYDTGHARQKSWFWAIKTLHSRLSAKKNEEEKGALKKLRAEGMNKKGAVEIFERANSHASCFDPLRYPIPAFLMEHRKLSEDEADLATYEQPNHSALQRFYFMALINSPDNLALGHMATVLRRSLTEPCLGYSAFVKSLSPIGQHDDLVNMQQFISEHLDEDHHQNSAFVEVLVGLAGLVKPPPVPTENRISAFTSPQSNLTQSDGRDELVSSTILHSVTEASTSTDLAENIDPYAISTSEVSPELPSDELVDAPSRVNRRWEARHHRITPNDYTRLTPIERRQVSCVLAECLQSPDKHKADGAAAVFLMYATGMQLGDLLAARVGDGGDFSADGKYRRSLKLPADAYEPPPELTGYFETYQNRIELQLPAMILPWMNECLGRDHETLLQCMGGDEQRVRESVKDVMDRVRASGRFKRIRAERIPAALALELALKYQDSSVSFFLSGRANHEAPMLSYYVAHRVDELARRYSQTVHELLELPVGCPPDTGVATNYSGHFPTVETINRFREGVTEKFRSANAGKESIISRHNAFTSYCLGMLLLSTGHRPSTDPFSSVNHFHLDSGLLLICDKATDQTRAWRLVALPQMAVSQMRVYLDYLPKLAAHLQPEWPSSDLPQRILRVVEGEADILPLFFMLSTSGGLKHVSVSESQLTSEWSAFWPLPVNFLRHIMATLLLQYTNRADYVQIQLGHMNGVDHPLGQKSTEPAIKTLSEIGASLDDILRELGWGVMEHRTRLPALGPARDRPGKLEPIVLGPALRLVASEKREAEAGDLMKRIATDQPRSAGKLLPDEFEELLQRVDSGALELGYSVKRCRKILYRYIRRQRGGKELLRQKAYTQVEPEPSPFTAATLASYRALTKLRVAFLDLLDRQGRSHSAPAEEERLAEIVCSAALFGGVANSSRLQTLVHALQSRIYLFPDQLFVDIPLGEGERGDPVTRWFPDKISSSLIEGYYKARKPGLSLSKISERSVQTLLECLGSPGEQPLKRLADHSKAGLIIEAPGYVVAAATGVSRAVSLKYPAWARVVRGQALTGKAEALDAGGPSLGWSPVLNGAADSWSRDQSKTFLHRLKRIISSVKTAPRTASKGVKGQQKKALIDLLKAAAYESPTWPVLPKLLAGWAVHLCKHGTSFKADLAYATIEKYLMLVANRLCPAAVGLGNFLVLEADDFERLYLTVVSSEPEEGRFELARQLQAFHAFIIDRYWLDDLDWSAVMAAAGGSLPIAYADANYITSAEYQRALHRVLQDESLPEIQRWQCAGLLIWGYRFGLRFGEAFRLHYQDIQREGVELYLWVHNTLHGEVKTNSSRRVVGLIEQLSSSETQVLDKLLSSGKSDFEEDHLIALMRCSAGSRELLNRSQVVQYLGRLLKAVTRDEGVRFHHLRHGWVSRQIGILAGVSLPGFSDETQNPQPWLEYPSERKVGYPLRSISVGVGHASEVTTLGSYTHCLDLVASKYYPESSSLSDFAIAYAEQVSPDTPRRRRARGRNSGRRAQIPSPDIKTSKLSEVLSRPASREPKPFRLPEVDLLLRRFSDEGQPIEAVALQLGRDIVDAQAILKRATKVETLSGYRGYRLAERSDDPVARAAISSHRTEKLFKEETARLYEYLVQLTTSLESLPHDEQREFFDGVQTWLQSTGSDPMVSIVADFEALHALLRMAGKLNASAEVLIEPSYDVRLLKELKVPVTVTHKLPVRKQGGKAGRVGVKLRSPKEIRVDRSLRRLLFLLATYGSV